MRKERELQSCDVKEVERIKFPSRMGIISSIQVRSVDLVTTSAFVVI